MRRSEHCLNSTVDMCMQERSYSNHIMVLRNIKSTIVTSKPTTPLRFNKQQDDWEKNRQEVNNRSSLIQSKTNLSKINSHKDDNFFRYSEHTSRSMQNSQSSRKTSNNNLSTKNFQRSQLHHNYFSTNSQVFLTQSNINSKQINLTSSPKKIDDKSKIDGFISKQPQNHWKQAKSPKMNDTASNKEYYIKDRIKKKVTNSPYCPAADKVIKNQRAVSSMFKKRYLRTVLAKKQNNTNNSAFFYETESECNADITDDNISNEINIILKKVRYASPLSNSKKIVTVIRNEGDNNNSINNNEDGDQGTIKVATCNIENDFINKKEQLNDTSIDNNNNNNNETQSNDKRNNVSIYESDANSNVNQKELDDDNNTSIGSLNDFIQPKKRKKVKRKKIRRVKIIRATQSDALNEISLSDE